MLKKTHKIHNDDNIHFRKYGFNNFHHRLLTKMENINANIEQTPRLI